MNPKKILIIEDDAQLREIYQKKLTIEGFSVFQAATIREGLTLLKSDTPDLIILDIMLPGGENGFDFLETVKRDPLYEAIPILVMTNLDTEEKVARQIGASDYIIKANTQIDEVITKIKQYLQS